MSIDWLPFILQTSDPLFPTGSYAHSFGFEEFVRLTGASDEAALHHFLDLHILPALTCQELPYLRFAHIASRANDLSALATLDSEISAWKISSELRAASKRIGVRRMETLLKVAPGPLLTAVAKSVGNGEIAGHHLIISAVQYAAIPVEAALMTYLYQTLSTYCVAAPKLIRIGQEACQRVLSACLGKGVAAVRGSLGVQHSQAGCFNPLLEIASMRHQTAFERLFIS